MKGPLLLERHVLASNADAYDQAWRTFGVSPGLARETARLESAVPWGVGTAEEEDAPRLDGDAALLAAPDNYDRVNSAFYTLPFGDAPRPLAYSVWGAVGERMGRINRVATHTIVIPPHAFSWIAGHPAALVASRGRPAPWLVAFGETLGSPGPVRLEPFPLDGPEAARNLERDRRWEVIRLRDRLVDRSGGDRAGLARRLGALYEGLALVLEGNAEQVALRGDGTAAPKILARLTWLSLPIADRRRVSFTTEASQAGSGGWTLAVVTEKGAAPSGTLLLEEGAFDTPRNVSEGRRHWSKLVVLFSESAGEEELVDSYPRMVARLDVRGGSLLTGRVVETELGISRWREDTAPGIERAVEIVKLEASRGSGEGVPRLRAAGRLLAEAIGGPPATEAADVDEARLVMDRIEGVVEGSDRAARLLRGILHRSGIMDAALLARLRIEAVQRGLAPPESLELLMGPERTALLSLLSSDRGPERMMAALRAAAAGGWADRGILTTEAMRHLAAPEGTIAEVRHNARCGDPDEMRWVCVFLEALEGRWPDRFPDTELLDSWLVPTLDRPRGGQAVNVLREWLNRPPVAVAYASAGGDPLADYVRGARPTRGTLTEATEAVPGTVVDVISALCRSGRGDDALALLEHLVEGAFPHDARHALIDTGHHLPPAWIGRRDVLELLLQRADALGDELLDALLLALFRGSVSLRLESAEFVLRHLWRRGDRGAALIGTIERDVPPARAAHVLTQLLDSPPPPPLYVMVRAALSRLLRGPLAARVARGELEVLKRAAPGLLPDPGPQRVFFLTDDSRRSRRLARSGRRHEIEEVR